MALPTFHLHSLHSIDDIVKHFQLSMVDRAALIIFLKDKEVQVDVLLVPWYYWVDVKDAVPSWIESNYEHDSGSFEELQGDVEEYVALLRRRRRQQKRPLIRLL